MQLLTNPCILSFTLLETATLCVPAFTCKETQVKSKWWKNSEPVDTRSPTPSVLLKELYYSRGRSMVSIKSNSPYIEATNTPN